MMASDDPNVDKALDEDAERILTSQQSLAIMATQLGTLIDRGVRALVGQISKHPSTSDALDDEKASLNALGVLRTLFFYLNGIVVPGDRIDTLELRVDIVLMAVAFTAAEVEGIGGQAGDLWDQQRKLICLMDPVLEEKLRPHSAALADIVGRFAAKTPRPVK